VIIVACGSKKRNEPSRARDLYAGPYFRAALSYALAVAPARDVFILSAKYGLVGLNEVIAPYDKKLGDPFSVTEFSLTDQAEVLGLLQKKVVVLGGKINVGLCRKVWRDVEAPLEGKGGIGAQIAWLKAQKGGSAYGMRE